MDLKKTTFYLFTLFSLMLIPVATMMKTKMMRR